MSIPFIKHSCENEGAFGRYEPDTCERCQQLVDGAPRRTRPRIEAIKRLKREEERRNRDIENHNCERSNCGPVCTAFDW